MLWPEGASDSTRCATRPPRRSSTRSPRGPDAPLVAGTVTSATAYVLQHLDAVAAGEGHGRLLRQAAPRAVRRVRARPRVLAPFAPDLIDLIQREYTPGTTDMVMDVELGRAIVLAGIAICFDIVDDQIMTETVEQGAQVIFAQTNNADFGGTDESVQQLAIARIRAIELGRSVVNISTVGTSAVILPDGSIIEQLPRYEPGTMVDDVPLARRRSPRASWSDGSVEWLVSAAGLIALAERGFTGERAQTRRAR